MREICEFRVLERHAERLFSENEGQKLGGIARKIKLATTDPRYRRVGELQRDMQASTGKSFFLGWDLHRRYTNSELRVAECFQWIETTTFNAAGEERGTKYDESVACAKCGAGAMQVTDLFLDYERLPQNKDIIRTIAGEVIASKRVVDLFRKENVSGAEFKAIRRSPKARSDSADWFQMKAQYADAEIAAPTRVGIDPFDDDPDGRNGCPNGDLIGLNLLSEVSVNRLTYRSVDILCTKEFFGIRQGLLRPERLILISPKVWRLIQSEKLKGFKVEVAHLV